LGGKNGEKSDRLFRKKIRGVPWGDSTLKRPKGGICKTWTGQGDNEPGNETGEGVLCHTGGA